MRSDATLAQKAHTWTCARCRCEYTDPDGYIPLGWMEITVNWHNHLGRSTHYLCELCTRSVKHWCAICEEEHA